MLLLKGVERENIRQVSEKVASMWNCMGMSASMYVCARANKDTWWKGVDNWVED